MKARKIPSLTIEEYIAQERDSQSKYEYHDGQIFALAGGTINHGLLCGNVYSELKHVLKQNNANCKPTSSEIKLNIASQNSFVYPDTMVICGPLETSEQDKNAITNPTLIVEVLSKSTSNYDRGDKFFLYKKIPSLQEYVLVEQDKPQVDIFYKKPGTDLWTISRYEGLESNISLQSLSVELKMSALYFDIEGLVL